MDFRDHEVVERHGFGAVLLGKVYVAERAGQDSAEFIVRLKVHSQVFPHFMIIRHCESPYLLPTRNAGERNGAAAAVSGLWYAPLGALCRNEIWLRPTMIVWQKEAALRTWGDALRRRMCPMKRSTHIVAQNNPGGHGERPPLRRLTRLCARGGCRPPYGSHGIWPQASRPAGRPTPLPHRLCSCGRRTRLPCSGRP